MNIKCCNCEYNTEVEIKTTGSIVMVCPECNTTNKTKAPEKTQKESIEETSQENIKETKPSILKRIYMAVFG
jgi:ribosome-binding protein aMBF1 (putative translation factor)